MVTAGIDIGGTKTTAVLADADGVVLASRTITSGRGGRALLDGAARLLTELELSSGLRAGAIGVGAAGVIDPGSGKVVAASGTFPDWAGRYPGHTLSEHLGRPVRLVNDVNAFLGGEVRWGVLRGARDALAIMLGTGVGGALLLDGRLHDGPRGSAGEIGHTPGYSLLPCTCGGIGHLETLASGRSLGLRYAELTGTDGLSGQQVADLARAGDAAAGTVFTRAAEALARSVVIATTMLDLTDVVVGGGVSAAWDLLEPPLIAGLQAAPPATVPVPRVHRASLASTALGAAALAHSTRFDTAL